ncbi:MAG: FAD-binding oxidoreductase [Ilumatobacteraceae bacterium]
MERWRTIVGPGHVLTHPDLVAPYVTDWTGRWTGTGTVVVRPGSVDEVAEVVEVCRDEHIAIVPQGGNTGMVGGSVPLRGEVLVSLRRLDHIGEVDPVAQQVSVGAGVTVSALQAAAAAAGLRYAVDFGGRDSATVGGSIATNAGGINLIRYGGTREQLVGIEAVLGTGQVVRRMSGLVKDNTGYHLPSLLCGSEGTLGIVTEARVRLVPAAAQRVLAIVAFGTVDDAVAAVAVWRRMLRDLEAAELVLHDGVELVASTFGLPLPFVDAHPVYVLVETAGPVDPTDALADAVASVAGVRDVAVAPDERRRASLWRLREDHALAINRVGVPHKFDITVPHDRISDFVARVPSVVSDAAAGARTWIFGHVGDGNLHVNVTGVAPEAPRLDEAVYRFVVDTGGSISAEHGIGTAKVAHLPLQRSTTELAAMRAIKSALDPAGIMNPGVLFG